MLSCAKFTKNAILSANMINEFDAISYTKRFCCLIHILFYLTTSWLSSSSSEDLFDWSNQTLAMQKVNNKKLQIQ